jgi:predicted acylesterase/phospholipase RssA
LLGDLDQEILICASELDRYQGKTFTRDDRDISLVDAALASAAAPTFFAPVVPDNSHRGYIDGGLWANDPLLVAVAHARSRGFDPAQIEAFALGTGRVTKGASPEQVALMRPLSPEAARFLIDTTGSLQEWSASWVLEQLAATSVHRVNPELTKWIGLDDSKAAAQQLPGLAELEYERYGEMIRNWLRQERRPAPEPNPPLSPPLEDGIRAAGISRFMPARRYYAIYREGRESISSYIRRTRRTLTMVSINLAVGAELERIERVFAELLDEDPAICIRVSLLDPADRALMEVIGPILDVRPDRIAGRIADTMARLIEFRDGLEGDLRSQVELFHHRTIPSASAILIDVNTAEGVIQLETKPYKAPATSSWAMEIEAGSEFFETMREAYHAVVEDGKEV